MNTHRYETRLVWTGNSGSGTNSYESYSRNFEVACAGKSVLEGSSDKAFRGDPSRYNPEELLLAALSSCHMLTYLHACAVNRVVVVEYVDVAEGILHETGGSGAFAAATLRPRVTIGLESDPDTARSLHQNAHRDCFIARSVAFPVEVAPEIIRAGSGTT